MRRIHALQNKLRHTKVSDLSQDSLHEFIDKLQIGIMDLHVSLAEAYFPPPLQLEEAG